MFLTVTTWTVPELPAGTGPKSRTSGLTLRPAPTPSPVNWMENGPAEVLTSDKEVSDFFEEVVGLGAPAKAACNWVTQDVLRVLSEKKVRLEDLQVTPRHIAEMVSLVEEGVINYSLGRNKVFPVMVESGKMPKEVVEEEGLAQVSDAGEVEAACVEAIEENPKAVEDFKGGKKGAVNFLFGQVMRKMKGKANPQVVREVLTKALEEKAGG